MKLGGRCPMKARQQKGYMGRLGCNIVGQTFKLSINLGEVLTLFPKLSLTFLLFLTKMFVQQCQFYLGSLPIHFVINLYSLVPVCYDFNSFLNTLF